MLLTGPIPKVYSDVFLQIALEITPSLHYTLLEKQVSLLLMPEDLIEIVDHDLSNDNCLAGVDYVSETWFFGVHEGGTKADGQVVRTHFRLLLHWNYISP